MKELLQLVADTQKKLSEYGKDVKSGPRLVNPFAFMGTTVYSTLSNSWSWVMDRSLALFKEYPSGLTLAILHSELEWQWNKVRQSGSGGALPNKCLQMRRFLTPNETQTG